MVWILILTWYCPDGSHIQNTNYPIVYENTVESCSEYGQGFVELYGKDGSGVLPTNMDYRCELRDARSYWQSTGAVL